MRQRLCWRPWTRRRSTGPEFYRLGFGEAVAHDLLTDYKVLVLAVDETAVAKTFQAQLSEDRRVEARRCGQDRWLLERSREEWPIGALVRGRSAADAPGRRLRWHDQGLKEDRGAVLRHRRPVRRHPRNRRATARQESVLTCEVQHVDGTFNALERNTRLDWLKADVPEGRCRILTNARCLSEGVDVPALNAVMFLSPRKSVVDVVQSVGRVMRKAPGKKYGYIILPVAIPEGATPEQALRDNTKYAAVWEVLQALRAHDDRFDAMVNRIDLTSQRDRQDQHHRCRRGGGERDVESRRATQQTLALSLANLDEWRDAVYAKIVAKVGSRRYWEDWANDVAKIAERHITRITALLDDDRTTVSRGLRELPRRAAGQSQRVHHPHRCNRDARPAPHHSSRVRRPVRRVRLRSPQPGRADDGTRCWPCSMSSTGQ